MEEKKQEDFGNDGVDEFFGDDVEQEGAQPSTMADRELAALRERLTILGYQDGVDDGVQEAVQGGFDQGYSVGAAAGWDAGSLYGGAAAARAALVASHERLAEVGAARTARSNTAATNNTLEDGSDAFSVGSWAGGSSVAGGGGNESVAATALPGGKSPGSFQIRQLGESDEKDAAMTGAAGGLKELVEELRHAIMLGPDGPGAPDRAEVLRRLRLVGPAGEAVADSLDDECP